MGRPPKHDKRDQQLNLKFTRAESKWIRGRAATVGLRPGEFGRVQVLAERRTRAKREAISASPDARIHPVVVMQFARIGNNLNQIARRLHQLQITPPAELEPLLQAIRDLLQRAARHGS